MNKQIYSCQKCGSQFTKWSGKCNDCNSWNTIIEETFGKKLLGKTLDIELLQTKQNSYRKNTTSSQITELDRVLGGGMVTGSVILLGGEPGIGKSTLVLQIANSLNENCLYISGEESIEQIRLRADRLQIKTPKLNILIATNLENIEATLTKHKKETKLIVVDSIQTIYSNEAPSSPGTVTQVRNSAYRLINFAKDNDIVLLLIGHVTKEGQIAGPKVLEHMVDTVLYFENESTHQFRILRSVKNRFGPANEIGIFEMREKGLSEVKNPSFISDYDEKTSGTAIFAGIEGTRPILVEVQALVAKTNMATPRRTVVGWDVNRLAMIVAILGSRYGIFIGDKEIYLNIAGGIKVQDPAADLAVAAAILSATLNIPIPKKTVIFGEVALSGKLRKVAHQERRIKEALRMRFDNIISPIESNKNIKCTTIKHVQDLKKIFNSS
ncbi:MAG: DNA repair protein RadA [Rickettsiaceae bacterium H1]|nr:DNA repair protein RadA [Rickettsiaceae bacterium H1]